MKNEYLIAIDPDVEKSGVAELNTITRELQLSSLPFPELLHLLKCESENRCMKMAVVVEAGYLNKPNFHIAPGDSARVAAAKGNAVGRNGETARKIIEMCRYWGIQVLTAKPLPKCWAGKDRKITHEELAAFTGIKKRTNQDQRDAALIAWIYAGFPIRIVPKPKK